MLPGGAKLPETLAEQMKGFVKYLYELPTALFRPNTLFLENLKKAFEVEDLVNDTNISFIPLTETLT